MFFSENINYNFLNLLLTHFDYCSTVIIRMAHFIHNIVNIEQEPKLLKDQIKKNVKIHKGGYNLRNKISSKSTFKNT